MDSAVSNARRRSRASTWASSGRVGRGSRRRLCERPWATNATAYRNPAGELVCVVRNPFAREHPLTVELSDGRSLAAKLPAMSLNTLVLPA